MKRKNATKRDSNMLYAGERLKKLRKDAGLTQDELAELIDNLPENTRPGRSRNQISCIENGIRSISADYARLLSKVLNVTPEYLLLETPYKNTFDEKYHSENSGKYIEKFFNDIGYKVEHSESNRFNRIITSAKYLKNKEYISSLIERCEYDSPIYERFLTDAKGRKILIYSDELQDIFDEVMKYAKWKIEQKFNDPRRYKKIEDMKGTFNNENKVPDIN